MTFHGPNLLFFFPPEEVYWVYPLEKKFTMGLENTKGEEGERKDDFWKMNAFKRSSREISEVRPAVMKQ